MRYQKLSGQTFGRGFAGFGALALFAGFLATAAPVEAQITSGKLTGVVTDAQTGEALAGAQIYLDGTGLGSLSAENGRYFVINVPPGTYAVVAELIGYQSVRSENVVIVIDATYTLFFEMTPQAIAVEEIRVEVEATPLIQLDARGSTDLISSEQLYSLPVNTIEEALSLKQGFFRIPDNENILAFTEKSRGITPIRIRGGRNAETVTLIDGIPINNFIFGGPAFSLTKAAVGQLTFLKGGFPPEYGNALSGIINIATKNPGTNIAGTFEYQTSALAGALGSTPDELNDFRFLEGDVEGPVPGTNDKLRFLIAGRKSSEAARVLEFDDDVFDPSNPPTGRLNLPNTQDVFAGWRAFGYDDDTQIFGKLTYDFTPNTKVAVLIVDDTRQFQRYDFDFLLTYDEPVTSPLIDSQADSLFVEGLRDNWEVALGSLQADRTLFVGTFNQVFGRSFLNINFGIFNQKRTNCNFFEGVCLGNDFADINFTGDQFAATGTGESVVNSPTRGTDALFGGEDITSYILRGDFVSQVTDHHNLQFGVFADFHDLTFDEDTNVGVNDLFVAKQRYEATPWDAAFYLQDVIEYDFIKLDLGLRIDFGQAGGLFFADPTDPTNGTTAREVCSNPGAFGTVTNPVTLIPITPNSAWTLSSCSDPATRDSAAVVAFGDDYANSETRVQVSPRLGVSFPVTASTNVFFNYSINTMNPQLNNIYQNTAIGTSGEGIPCGFFDDESATIASSACGPIIFSGDFAVPFLGNPNLEIEKTSTYEFGLLAEVGDNWALSMILFNKDQFGLTGLRQVTGIQDIGATYTTSTPQYTVLVNEDFQTVRGLEVGVQRRLANYWALDVNYSFSTARTNAAPPERAFENEGQGDPTIRREIRSEIDIPHRLNGVIRFNTGVASPELFGDGGAILRHSNLALSAQVGSGVPYTPTLTFSGFGTATQQLEPNSGRGPANYRVDLRASKGLPFGNMVYALFVQVNNLFDTLNCVQPLPTTGRCDSGARDQSRRRQGNSTGEGTTSTFFDRPHLFDSRREINLGIRATF